MGAFPHAFSSELNNPYLSQALQANFLVGATESWVTSAIEDAVAGVEAGIVTDHGSLTGLSDDDHPQYHNDSRGDARYVKTDLSNVPSGLATQTELDAEASTRASADTALDGRLDTLEAIDYATQVELNTHKSSSDHDGRYYTEAEVDGLLAATRFVWRGEYSSLTAYVTGDAVFAPDTGSSWVAVAGSTNQPPSDSSIYWDILASVGADGADGADGDTGAAGQGFTFKSTWSSGSTYDAYDVVTRLGSTYVATQGSNTNHAPETNVPTWWDLMAIAGADGADGADGATGPAGPAGDLVWQGAYVGATAYTEDDVVTYLGQTYRRNNTSPGFTGDPVTSPTLWDIVAKSGEGVPVGGSTNQVLRKASATNYDTNWVSLAASLIGASAYGNLSGSTVHAQLQELEDEKQPIDADLTAIAALSPANNDIVQRKSGAWTNRTMAQLVTDLDAAGVATDAELAAHVTDTSAAHAASAISYAGGTGMSATDVEAAIDELAIEKSNTGHTHAQSDITNLVTDLAGKASTSHTHAASVITYAGGTGMSATDVEAAIDELATEKVSSDVSGEVASGYNAFTSNVALTTTVATLATITVDGKSSAKAMMIEGFVDSIGVATAGSTFELYIYDGATAVQRARGTMGTAGGVFPGSIQFRQDPFTGTKTFTIRAKVSAGTGSANANASWPGFIRAEWC